MAVNVRARRVSDLFGSEAKARLVGGGGGRDPRHLSYASSGSEHEAECDSPCLSELVYGFLEDDDDSASGAGASPDYDSDSDRADLVADCTDEVEGVVRQALSGNVDSYGRLLHGHVLAAAEAFKCLRSDKALFRRRVMIALREIGHNAAICKTRWSASGGLNAGNHEFVDVIQPAGWPSGLPRQLEQEQIRYLVDVDFAGEFEVARPTDQYSKLLNLLPRVFVGRGDDLKRIARAMSAAAKRSLKSRGLSLPPWKKNRYMQNKWLGPYRRTVNPTPAGSLTPAVSSVKCRAVGFDDAINGPMSVRTR
ncbi:uncharacterized protein LOC116189639 [Punica granatum]|uniref:Uncharacterized protein LOC116189639 n=2 Tax=Punica granatum TaxID=22663 RepID=A0A6P8BY70_PUNGR|nr:uncharacterized protein LOC116189639 [Punica granatum]PKI67372.1 hypothetical protein CRG98_012242 [Punica granatum]